MRARIVVCGIAALCAACGPSTQPVHTPVSVEQPYSQMEARFFAAGQPIEGVTSSGDDTFRFWHFFVEGTLRGDEYTLPALTVEFALPCGRKQFALELESGSLKPFVAQVKAGQPFEVAYRVAHPPEQLLPAELDLLPILVDNRNGEAGELRVGEMRRAIPANSQRREDLFDPLCAAAPVTFNGKDLGRVPGKVLQANPNAMVLISVQDRCYNLTRVAYSFQGIPTAGYKPPVPTPLAGQHVYVLPTYRAYAPNDVPSSISAGGSADAEVYELADRKC